MRGRTGVWLIGACGNVATLTVAGARAIARGLAGRVGLVTELPRFREAGLPPLEGLVFGGHEVRGRTLVESAREFSRRAGVLSERLLAEIEPDLEEVQAFIRPGVEALEERAPGDAIEAIRADLRAFRERGELEELVVVNVATTEPYLGERREWGSLDRLREALEAGLVEPFPPSVLYAYAALEEGCAYVNFTPSPGSSNPALDELARLRGTVHAGRDGKTGETLVKTVLAPLFAQRHLKVHAWEGYNMLGNADGAALRDPRARQSKYSTKDRSLRAILGEEAGHHSVHIDYVPSLDDWKVAFDYIHFEGFLGARMALQFTWQGCDSALAAPLVLDLVRIAARARARGETGALPYTACFFKDPYGTDVHAFPAQFSLLSHALSS